MVVATKRTLHAELICTKFSQQMLRATLRAIAGVARGNVGQLPLRHGDADS
jgi:hypothetical protein